MIETVYSDLLRGQPLFTKIKISSFLQHSFLFYAVFVTVRSETRPVNGDDERRRDATSGGRRTRTIRGKPEADPSSSACETIRQTRSAAERPDSHLVEPRYVGIPSASNNRKKNKYLIVKPEMATSCD